MSNGAAREQRCPQLQRLKLDQNAGAGPTLIPALAGNGIRPIMSMLRLVDANEQSSFAGLIVHSGTKLRDHSVERGG